MTARAECLDWRLIAGRGPFEEVLRVSTSSTTTAPGTGRYSSRRRIPTTGLTTVGEDCRGTVHLRNLVGGLLHEYRRAAERVCAPFGVLMNAAFTYLAAART